MKKLLFFAVVLLLFSVPALAQEYPRGEAFGGFTYERVDISVVNVNAYGWHFAVNGNFHPHFGIEGEISGAYGSTLGVNFQNYTFLGGPRVMGQFDKGTVFAHALFGYDHARAQGAFSENDFAWAAGGGVDYNINKTWAWRVAQVDYLQIRVREPLNFTSNSFRFSTGIVAKWGVR